MSVKVARSAQEAPACGLLGGMETKIHDLLSYNRRLIEKDPALSEGRE